MSDGIFLARPDTVGAGNPLAVKDLFDTAGLATTYGSGIFAEHVPTETAPAVASLEAAGYALVGKTNLHEFAYGTTSENPHFGAVPNPAAPGRVAGGSSGGSAAALAAGLADAALGTDSAGSIRIPAACCGIVGFKPSHGLVSLERCWPLAASFDTGGPMARDVAGCETLLADLVPGFEPRRARVAGGARARRSPGRSSPTRSCAPGSRAAAALFPRRRIVELPFPDPAVYAPFMREVADVHRELFAQSRGRLRRGRADQARALPRRARRRGRARGVACRAEYEVRVSEALDGTSISCSRRRCRSSRRCSAPAAPAISTCARRLIRFTFPFSALGWPALALPCGPAEDGLPASVQLAGRPGADALVLAAGRLLEAAL